MNTTVCCIIVTYGDRFCFLSRVIAEVFRQGVRKVVVVDNGSAPKSARALDGLVRDHSGNVILHRFEENEGSAKGFKTGIEIGRQTDCEFLWLLDDDNLPDQDALENLLQFWQGIDGSFSRTRTMALASLRKDRQVFINALKQRSTDPLLWPVNSFYGFHIFRLLEKIGERLASKGTSPGSQEAFAPLQIGLSFYGGLFFHKSLLQTIGLPNEELVLYSDDFWFTRSISQQNGEIWLVPDSTLRDIDTPYYLPKKKGFLYHSSLDGENNAQVYYSSRNSVYYIKNNLITNSFLYNVNKFVFLGFITLTGLLRGKLGRLKLIYKAIEDGEKGRLGKREMYKLG